MADSEEAVGAPSFGRVKSVTLLGREGNLEFTQDETGLKVTMPAEKPCDYAFALKITGALSINEQEVNSP